MVAQIGRAAHCAKVMPHHRKLAAPLQARFEGLARDLSLRQTGLLRFFPEGLCQSFAESNG
jgi:hypothetical protein